MNSPHTATIFFIVMCVCTDLGVAETVSPQQTQFFESKVRPLFAEHCWKCHGPDEQKGDLRLDSRGHMLDGGESGPTIVPGKPDESLLVEAVRYESYEMPPSGKLQDDQVEILDAWVRLGAPWPGEDSPVSAKRDQGPTFKEEDYQWWAIQPVAVPPVPEIANDDWSQNAIDRFVLQRLQSHGLSPASEANRLTLARRLFFDLLGLPPSPEEITAFLSDAHPDAYQRLVDRLLSSPRYAERWARHWLDLARYADSDGYRADHYREHAWRYRDYVIRSLNEDKPYDRFIQEQLAGDELYPDDPNALIATGFLTHGIYEYNNRDVIGHLDIMINELTDTAGDVFLGLGMQCARCHDHKFDPILQRDYFRLRAFFEPILFHNNRVAATHSQQRLYGAANRRWQRETKRLCDELAGLETPYRRKAEENAVSKFPPNIQAMINKPQINRTPREHQLASLAWRQVEFEYTKMDKAFKPADKERILALRRELAKHEHDRPTALPMAQSVSDVSVTAPATVIPKKRREVQPGFPTVMNVKPAQVTNNSSSNSSTGRRSALAHWLTRPENPLSTRVIVNRVWQHHFGRGLASNASDFGRLGGSPTHPELLDWLTVRFLEGDWSLKKLHRLIVTSATYRQSTSHSQYESYAQKDAANQWYWRTDTRRLDAEQVRDSILAATDQLDSRCFGPGVLPDQPRRSVYVRVMRNARDPLLDVFDLPLFFTSTSQRDRTTSPIQSLLLINSQTMLNHATELARNVVRRRATASTNTPNLLCGSLDLAIDPTVVRNLWQTALGRQPTSDELIKAVQFIESQVEMLRQNEQVVTSQNVKTGQIPYRDGQSIVLDPANPTRLDVIDDDQMDVEEFSIEAYFQVRSIYESGSVRTIAAKWDGNRKSRGWSFGVTGKGSRRKPQTLVLQLFGKSSQGTFAEAAVFSDQHIELNKPYYAAASIRMAGDQPGSVDFFLKDLADDDVPMSHVSIEHSIVGDFANDVSMTIGRRTKATSGLFDGLIDDIRLSRRPLEVADLLLTNEAVDVDTIGYWQFEADPGIYRDSTPYGRHIQTAQGKREESDPQHAALIDLCHVLLNSNEFLYVD